MNKIILLASLLLNLNAFCQTPNYVPSNGLVGFWPFSGSANDVSANNLNGTASNTTLAIDRFNKSNGSYSFNGTSSFINVPANSALNLTSAMSFSIWFKIDFNAAATTEGHHLLVKGSNTTNEYSIVVDQNSKKVGFNKQGLERIVSSPNQIMNNTWTHVAVSYQYPTANLYINGQLVAQGNILNAFSSSSTPLNFGTINGITNSNTLTNGLIDDIGIWNRSLTAQEVSDLYVGNICYQNITVTDTLLINTVITSFNPRTYQNTIKIWPNPTSDYITIDNGNITNLTGYQIKITNSLSQQVFQSAITQQQFQVDLSTWTGNGVYFVHIIDGQGNTIDIKKIILQ